MHRGSRRAAVAVTMLATALASLATDRFPCADVRRPADGTPAWDPNEPLLLGFGYTNIPHDAAGVMSHIEVRGPDGQKVELIGASSGNALAICPMGGLRPDTDYEWEVTAFGTNSSNQASIPEYSRTGIWTFHTAATSPGTPVTSERECHRLARSNNYPCETADTGRTTPPIDTDDTDPSPGDTR